MELISLQKLIKLIPVGLVSLPTLQLLLQVFDSFMDLFFLHLELMKLRLLLAVKLLNFRIVKHLGRLVITSESFLIILASIVRSLDGLGLELRVYWTLEIWVGAELCRHLRMCIEGASQVPFRNYILTVP